MNKIFMQKSKSNFFMKTIISRKAHSLFQKIFWSYTVYKIFLYLT